MCVVSSRAVRGQPKAAGTETAGAVGSVVGGGGGSERAWSSSRALNPDGCGLGRWAPVTPHRSEGVLGFASGFFSLTSGYHSTTNKCVADEVLEQDKPSYRLICTASSWTTIFSRT
jgi:hypothetical protein